MLFSIITITFNAGETLPATLASTAEQTWPDFEHIIVDGASKDSTLDIARRAQTERGDYFRIVSEPDRGLYDAMNKGLRMARGEYLLFLNAGDTFASRHTLYHYAKAAMNGRPDIIYSDTLLVDNDRKVIGRRHLSVPERLSFKSFAKGMLVCHQAFCVRRDLAPEYDLSYRFSADYDWCVRILKQTSPERCVNLHEAGIHYLTDGLTDRNHKASLRERYRIMERHYGTLPTFLRHLSFVPRALLRKLTRR